MFLGGLHRNAEFKKGFGISELAVQATSKSQSSRFKQLPERASGTPAGPPHGQTRHLRKQTAKDPPLGSFWAP
eukprot:10097903-Alexandrium_andersonii.AAC.1